jgi:hypothetical protein
MTTKLDRLDAAFASTMVAVYEPIIARWTSQLAVYQLADALSGRVQVLPLPEEEPQVARYEPSATERLPEDGDAARALEAVRRYAPNATLEGGMIQLGGRQAPDLSIGERAPVAIGPAPRTIRELSARRRVAVEVAGRS